MDPKAEATLDQHVMDLYGLIHARYILTKRGMDKMVRHFAPGLVFLPCRWDIARGRLSRETN